MGKNKKKLINYIIISLAVAINAPLGVIAQSSSDNYKVEEYFFGTGGNVDTNSANYQSRQSGGSLGVGNSSSNGYDSTAGFNTPSEPFLEMVVTDATISFGTLDATAASTGAAQAGGCNCSFYVRTYLSSDYSVITMSNPPASENNDIITAKGILGLPSTDPNVEEFGINLVDNSSPDIGANPINRPDNSFADGRAATGYDTPNNFKYAAGDIIASSPKTAGNQGVGLTEYTISYMLKIKSLTPAGIYTMHHDLVALPTF